MREVGREASEGREARRDANTNAQAQAHGALAEQMAQDPIANLSVHLALPRAVSGEVLHESAGIVEKRTSATKHFCPRQPGRVWHRSRPTVALSAVSAHFSTLVVDALDVDDVARSRRNGVLRVLGKGQRVRHVQIHPQLRSTLAGWLDERPDWPGASDAPALFLSQRGQRFSVRGAHDIVTAIAAAAGLDDHATVYVLRHTFATALVGGGTDLVIVVELLGHPRLEAARAYTSPIAEKTAQGLASLLAPRRQIAAISAARPCQWSSRAHVDRTPTTSAVRSVGACSGSVHSWRLAVLPTRRQPRLVHPPVGSPSRGDLGAFCFCTILLPDESVSWHDGCSTT